MEQTIGWLGLGEVRIFLPSSEIDSVAMRIAVNSAVNMQLLSFSPWFRLIVPFPKEQPTLWSCIEPSTNMEPGASSY